MLLTLSLESNLSWITSYMHYTSPCIIHSHISTFAPFHPTLHNGCNYLSMLGLKWNHVSKRGPRGAINNTPTLAEIMEWHRAGDEPLSEPMMVDSWLKHIHDDVIKWKHFPRYWPFVRGIHRHLWILLTKASDAELWCFPGSVPK